MIRHTTIKDAKALVRHWEGDPSSLVHIGNHVNSVFKFKNMRGEWQIIRLSDAVFRSLGNINAELSFVSHLYTNQTSVARPLPNVNGQLAFEAETKNGHVVCSSFEFVDGLHVNEESPHWNLQFFREWGRSLATIHNASVSHQPSAGASVRWTWDNELLFRRAEELLPVDDILTRNEISFLFAECAHLRQIPSEFGLIHADHAPQNFLYSTKDNCITAFDFDNCCYHWFIADVAISLSTVRRKPNRNTIKENLLDGYSSVRSLPADYDRLIDLFIRLRVVYFYLSRLHMWNNPTPEQKMDLLLFRDRVHSQTGW